MKQTLSNKAGIISFGKLSVSLSGLVAAMVLSRCLSETDYGTYRQIWLVFNTMVPLFILGLPISINYFIPQKDSSEQKAFNAQTYLLLTCSGIIFSMMIWGGASFIAGRFHNPNLLKMLRIFSFIPLLTLPTLYYQNLLVCLNRPGSAAAISSIMAISRLAAVAIPASLGASLAKIFLSLTVFSVFQLMVVSYHVFKPFAGIPLTWKRSLITRQLKYSIPIGLSTIVGTLTLQIDKFFISSSFSASQYAIYTNGAMEIPLIGILTGSVTAVLMPEFVKFHKTGNGEILIRTWHNAIRKVGLVIFPVMFFLLVFSTDFITVLFSAKYVGSTEIFDIYLMTLPMRITSFGMILLCMGFSSIVFRYSVYTLILNFFLNYVLIETIGFMGPAIATVVSIYLMGYIQLKKVAQKSELSMQSIFPWKTLVHIIVVSAGTGLVLVFAKKYFPMDVGVARLILGGVLYMTLFMAGAFFSHLMTKNDLWIPVNCIRGLWKK